MTGSARPIHRPKNVLDRLPVEVRLHCEGVQLNYLNTKLQATDDFKGTQDKPPSDRFANKNEYDLLFELRAYRPIVERFERSLTCPSICLVRYIDQYATDIVIVNR